MISSKRGFVFTVLALLIVVAILILASANQSLHNRTRTQTSHAHTMDRYLQNLEADLPRVAYIAGFRSLIGLEEHISANGTYLVDVDASFVEMFSNGTANGTYYTIMDNSTFTDFATRFRTLAARQGVIANLSLLSIDAYHESPWEITLNFSVGIDMADASGSIRFDRVVVTQARVPIAEVKDPLYTVGTQGRAPHSVEQSNVTRPFIDAANDTSRLQELVNGTLYIESVNGPSFLQRFEGNLSPSPFGIASLVPIKELRTQGMVIDECKSVVDHRYFASTPGLPNEIVNMDPNDFWLGDGDLADFDAVGKEVGSKPCP